MSASAVPSIPAAEYMDDTHRRDARRAVTTTGGANYPCPQCDHELEDGAIVPTWLCRQASCPTPSVVEGGARR